MDGESRTDTAPRKDADRRRATEESRIRLPRVSLRAGPEMGTHEEREEVEGDDQAEDEARERAKPAGDHQRRQPDSERLVSVFQTQPLDDLSTHRCVGTRPLTQYPAEAKPETRMGQDESGPSTLAKCLLCEAGAVFTCDGLRRRTSILDEVKPLTGEPDAGKPPVRFGGRGDRIQSVLPTPIIHSVPPGRRPGTVFTQTLKYRAKVTPPLRGEEQHSFTRSMRRIRRRSRQRTSEHRARKGAGEELLVRR